jgi:hypothetical protein
MDGIKAFIIDQMYQDTIDQPLTNHSRFSHFTLAEQSQALFQTSPFLPLPK